MNERSGRIYHTQTNTIMHFQRVNNCSLIKYKCQYRKLLTPKSRSRSEEAEPIVSRSGIRSSQKKEKRKSNHVHNVNSSITTKATEAERKEGWKSKGGISWPGWCGRGRCS